MEKSKEKKEEKKESQKHKKRWDSFVQIFFPLFTPIFSPIWRDCILKVEERKLVGPTTFLSPFSSQPNSEKCHFTPYFPLPIFHSSCFHPNQTYPKVEHKKWNRLFYLYSSNSKFAILWFFFSQFILWCFLTWYSIYLSIGDFESHSNSSTKTFPPL